MASPIIGRQRIAAELWNQLFEELDRKITVALDAKSPYLLGPGPMEQMQGKIFIFADSEADRIYTGGELPSDWLIPFTTYDHSIFENALADYDEDEIDIWDADKHICVLKREVDPSFKDPLLLSAGKRFFDQSLQAHTVEIDVGDPPETVKHWVHEPGQQTAPAFVPEKKWRYAMAEVILEGKTSLIWDVKWDKYNFFRFHNLHSQTCTISFPGGVQVVIPRWSCRTIRRKDDVYTAGYNYLQKMLPDDPRLLEFQSVGYQLNLHENTQQTPWGSMSGNNCTNPAVCYAWVAALTSGQWSNAGPQLWFDQTIINNISPLYSGIFPTPDDNVPIGDMLHHKGKLLSIKTDALGARTEEEIQFDGYATLATVMAEKGIAATENEDGSFNLINTDASVVLHDLWSISTNLLSLFYELDDGSKHVKIRPGVSLSSPVTLSNHPASDGPGTRQGAQSISTFNYQYSPLTESGGLGDPVTVSISVDRTTMNNRGNPFTKFRMLDWTVGSVKNLANWGAPESNARMIINGNTATLTPQGLVINWKERINLKFLVGWSFGAETIDAVHGDTGIEILQPDSIVFSRSVLIDNWGWATPTRRTAFFGDLIIGQPAFLSPRRGHRYIADTPTETIYYWDELVQDKLVWVPSAHHHPNIDDEREGTDGADFQIDKVIDKESERAEIAILTPLPLQRIDPTIMEGPHHFHGYNCPDVLKEFLDEKAEHYATKRNQWLANSQSDIRIVRCNLLREQFNAISTMVNALTKARPLLFSDWSPLGIADMGGPLLFGPLVPNSIGPFNGPYFPVDMYCSFADGSNEHQVCQALGIPVRTEADLPGEYHAVKNTKPRRFSIKTNGGRDWVLVGSTHIPNPPFPLLPHTIYTYDVTTSMGNSEIAFQRDTEGSLLKKEIFEGTSDDTTFLWCKIADVKAAAESRGFLFHLQRFGLPHRLRIFDVANTVTRLHVDPEDASRVFQDIEGVNDIFIPGPGGGSEGGHWQQQPPTKNGLHEDWPVDHYFSIENQASIALMTQSINGENPTWMRERIWNGSYTLQDYREGDRWTVRQDVSDFAGDVWNVIYLLNIGGTDQYRFLRQTPAFRYEYQNYRVSSMYHQNFRTAGLVSNEWLIMHEIPTVEHTTEYFSEESMNNAVGRLNYGPGVIPIEELPADAEATPAVTQMALQGNLILPIGPKAYEVILFRGWLTSI